MEDPGTAGQYGEQQQQQRGGATAHPDDGDAMAGQLDEDSESRAPTPSSPSSMSAGSLSGADIDDDNTDDVGFVSASSGNAQLEAGVPGPGPSTTAARLSSASSSGATTAAGSSSSRRRSHHHHSSDHHHHHHSHHRKERSLGTGASKMGSSVTDSAQSTEDELEEEDKDNDEDEDNGIHYPALATPTAKNGSFWPFGTTTSTANGDPSNPLHADSLSSDGTVLPSDYPNYSQARHVSNGSTGGAGYAQLARQSSSHAAFLPHEILLKILKNVRSTPDLVSSLLVCKSWCQCGVELLWNKPLFPHIGPLIQMLLVLSRPVSTFPYAAFIKRLNFSQLAERMSDALLLRLVVCDRLERLTLAGCSEVTDDSLVGLLKKCKNLVALDLSECGKITDATVQAAAANCNRLQGLNLSECRKVTDVGVQAIAQGCQLLRRVKLRYLDGLTDDAIIALALHCPLLLEVDLYSCTSVTDRTLWALFRNCSHLRELSLNNCTSVTGDAFPQRDGPVLYIKGANDPLLDGKKPVNAKFGTAPLLLGAGSSGANNNKRVTAEYMDAFPHLKFTTPLHSRMFEHVRYLDLTALTHLTDQAMEGIIATMPHIRNLVLAKCSSLTDESVLSICGLGKHLHFLHLAHVSNLTDRAVISLARSCTRLRYIDLACCISLTDLSVFELAQNLPRLKRIGLVRVTNVTDQAVLALAERTTLERIHLSYCEHITVSAVGRLLERLRRLNHLTLTGVPAFRRPDLQHFCRPPPKEYNLHQRTTFCIYSGKGVQELRHHLDTLRDRHGILLPGQGQGPEVAGGANPWAAYGPAFTAGQLNGPQGGPNSLAMYYIQALQQQQQTGGPGLSATQQHLLALATQQQLFHQQHPNAQAQGHGQAQPSQQLQTDEMEDDENEELDGDDGDEAGEDTEDDRAAPRAGPSRSAGSSRPSGSTSNAHFLPGPHSRPNPRLTGDEHVSRSQQVSPRPNGISQEPSSTSTHLSGQARAIRRTQGLWPSWLPQSTSPAPPNQTAALDMTGATGSNAIGNHPYLQVSSNNRPTSSSSSSRAFVPTPPAPSTTTRNVPSPRLYNHASHGSAPANLQLAPHLSQQHGGSSYLDTAPSPTSPSEQFAPSDASSHYLNIGALHGMLDNSVLNAAAEQEEAERRADADGDMRMRSASVEPGAQSPSVVRATGRPRRDTIRQDDFQMNTE